MGGLLMMFGSSVALGAQTPPPVDIELLINRGRLPEARAELANLRPRTRADSAKALYFNGRVELASASVSKAVSLLEESVKLVPNDGPAHYWLAVGYTRTALGKNKMTQARYARRVRTALERATHYSPKLVDARLYLIQYYLRAPFIVGGSKDKARAQADTILKIDRLSGHIARAQVAEASADLKTAERSFKASLDEFPKSEQGYYALGGFYRRTRRFGEAVEVFQRLQQLIPEQSRPHYQIGRTLAEGGIELDRGERELNIALSMGLATFDAANAHYHLGLIYRARGDETRAKESFARALKLDPTLEAAMAARQSVQRP